MRGVPDRPTRAPAIAAVHHWLDGAHAHLRSVAPDLDGLVTDYVGEARFGAAVIAKDLAELAPDATVLEVGAGALLLSCALHAAGYRVTALEPVGVGFSHMTHLRGLVLDYASSHGAAPSLMSVPAEALDARAAFDYAFSINVMEYVDGVDRVLQRVWSALRPGGAYRFVCPNYSFPFEPHFGIPTCWGKELTWRLFRRRILASRVVVDPAGTWQSLNWITVRRVRHVCRREFGVPPVFDRDVSYRFVRRALSDPSFQRRHGVAMRVAARALTATGLISLARFVPAAAQPAMSCRITRPV